MPASIARLSGGTSLKPIQNRRQLQYPRPGLQKFPVKNPVTGCLTHDCPLLTHDFLVSTKFYPVAPRFRLSPFAINFRSSLTLPTHPVRGDKPIAGEVVAAETCGYYRKALACPTAPLPYFNARKLAVIRHEPNSQVPNYHEHCSPKQRCALRIPVPTAAECHSDASHPWSPQSPALHLRAVSFPIR